MDDYQVRLSNLRERQHRAKLAMGNRWCAAKNSQFQPRQLEGKVPLLKEWEAKYQKEKTKK